MHSLQDHEVQREKVPKCFSFEDLGIFWEEESDVKGVRRDGKRRVTK